MSERDVAETAADYAYRNWLEREDGENYEEKGKGDGEEIYESWVDGVHWCNIVWLGIEIFGGKRKTMKSIKTRGTNKKLLYYN